MIIARKHSHLLIGALGALALTGCRGNAEAPTESVAGDKTHSLPAIKVQSETLKLTPEADSYVATGTVISKDRITVAAKIMGRISSLRCREGDHVKRGQVLFEIDDRDAHAKLETAEAALEEAREELEEAKREEAQSRYAKSAAEAEFTLAAENYKRYDELLKRNSISRQEFDNATAKYQAAQAQVAQAGEGIAARGARIKRAQAHITRGEAAVKQAQIDLTYCTVTAPADGIVAAKQANAGDMAQPGEPVVTIDSQNYRLEVQVDQMQGPLINQSSPVLVEIGGIYPAPVKSKIEEVVPAADYETRTQTVKLSLPQTAGLRSGLFGRAVFPMATKSIVEVPAEALVKQGQLTMVYVIDQEKNARLRLVKVGKTYGPRLEILSGLSPGDTIISANRPELADGIKVEM